MTSADKTSSFCKELHFQTQEYPLNCVYELENEELDIDANINDILYVNKNCIPYLKYGGRRLLKSSMASKYSSWINRKTLTGNKKTCSVNRMNQTEETMYIYEKSNFGYCTEFVAIKFPNIYKGWKKGSHFNAISKKYWNKYKYFHIRINPFNPFFIMNNSHEEKHDIIYTRINRRRKFISRSGANYPVKNLRPKIIDSLDVEIGEAFMTSLNISSEVCSQLVLHNELNHVLTYSKKIHSIQIYISEQLTLKFPPLDENNSDSLIVSSLTSYKKKISTKDLTVCPLDCSETEVNSEGDGEQGNKFQRIDVLKYAKFSKLVYFDITDFDEVIMLEYFIPQIQISASKIFQNCYSNSIFASVSTTNFDVCKVNLNFEDFSHNPGHIISLNLVHKIPIQRRLTNITTNGNGSFSVKTELPISPQLKVENKIPNLEDSPKRNSSDIAIRSSICGEKDNSNEIYSDDVLKKSSTCNSGNIEFRLLSYSKYKSKKNLKSNFLTKSDSFLPRHKSDCNSTFTQNFVSPDSKPKIFRKFIYDKSDVSKSSPTKFRVQRIQKREFDALKNKVVNFQ